MSEIQKIKSHTRKINNPEQNISKISWAVVDKISHYQRRKNSSVGEIKLKIGDDIISDPLVISNTFNQNFTLEPPSGNSNLPTSHNVVSNSQSVYFSPVTD